MLPPSTLLTAWTMISQDQLTVGTELRRIALVFLGVALLAVLVRCSTDTTTMDRALPERLPAQDSLLRDSLYETGEAEYWDRLDWELELLSS